MVQCLCSATHKPSWYSSSAQSELLLGEKSDFLYFLCPLLHKTCTHSFCTPECYNPQQYEVISGEKVRACAVPLWSMGTRMDWPRTVISPLVRQFAVCPQLSQAKMKCVPRGHSLAYLFNYCTGMCFRQLCVSHNRWCCTASEWNQWPNSVCQSSPRASCHLWMHRVTAALPCRVPGDTQILATDKRSQDTRSHKSGLHKNTRQPSQAAAMDLQFPTFAIPGQSSHKCSI